MHPAAKMAEASKKRHRAAVEGRACGGSMNRPGRARGGAVKDSPTTFDDNAKERERDNWGCGDFTRRADGGSVPFRTPSGSVSAGARRKAEREGDAMPGGRFPIRNASDLSNAKHDYGRANDKPAVKRWINKRAKELGEAPMGG